MDGVPEPDWYLDHVLVRTEPGSNATVVVTAADQWHVWWQIRLRHLDCEFPHLAAVAGRQGFSLRTRQLSDCGLPRHLVRRYVRDGQWSAPQPGVVSLVGPALCADDGADRFVVARRHHAVASAGAALANSTHAVSGPSAAVLLGLPTRHVPDRVGLTSPDRANARLAARCATLAPADLTSWFGARVTSVARTCVDLARHDRRAGLIACDAALHQSLVTVAELQAALDRARRWPGAQQAREIVGLADGRAESPLESVVRLALHDDGFPPPELQFRIPVAGRRQPLRVDLCWPHQRVILEADGRLKYDGDENWREKKREALLRPAGYRIERVIWGDVEQTWAATSAYLRTVLGL